MDAFDFAFQSQGSPGPIIHGTAGFWVARRGPNSDVPNKQILNSCEEEEASENGEFLKDQLRKQKRQCLEDLQIVKVGALHLLKICFLGALNVCERSIFLCLLELALLFELATSSPL